MLSSPDQSKHGFENKYMLLSFVHMISQVKKNFQKENIFYWNFLIEHTRKFSCICDYLKIFILYKNWTIIS